MAVANAPVGSRGLLGDLGGIGGGTRVLDPGGLSHNTAGRFKVSELASSGLAAAPGTVLFSEEGHSGDTGPETALPGKPEVDPEPSGECTVIPRVAARGEPTLAAPRWRSSPAAAKGIQINKSGILNGSILPPNGGILSPTKDINCASP